ncbi:hypothetical protein [Nesterenkonia ebinurensis]|uniref:hypothetical protein n=1 Tax=Nesterenkonia ebinurensis TaxID=2608252 RepID=UPI00123DF0FC|nr:hypothetical protein [Nesterenkonia ebinurensis]
MFKDWRRRRAVKKIKPGDGRALKPYRWWQWLSRALYYLKVTNHDGAVHAYAVDVDYWDCLLNEAKADLYLNGEHHAESKLPAAFPVTGGHIEVRMGPLGLKRCHFITEGDTEHQLRPDPDSAEGHRADLDRKHPVLSRWIGRSSLIFLVVALLLGIPQVVELVTSWEVIAQYTGTWRSPIQLPEWLNLVLIVGAIIASVERALRMRHNWLLDGGGDLDIDF